MSVARAVRSALSLGPTRNALVLIFMMIPSVLVPAAVGNALIETTGSGGTCGQVANPGSWERSGSRMPLSVTVASVVDSEPGFGEVPHGQTGNGLRLASYWLHPQRGRRSSGARVVAADLIALPVGTFGAVAGDGVFGARVKRGRLRFGRGLRRRVGGQGAFTRGRVSAHATLACTRVEDPVGEKLDAVAEQSPADGVGPHEPRPAPAEGCHEQSVHRDQGRDGLGAKNGEQEGPGGSDGPERAAGTGEEDREVAGDRQQEVHQGLQLRVAEAEDSVAEVEQAERGDRPDDCLLYTSDAADEEDS